MNRTAYLLYLLFCISFFLRFPERVDFLATARFDLLLMAAMVLVAILGQTGQHENGKFSNTARVITGLVLYVFLSLPFVQWPGSVLHTNTLIYLKVLVFFYFSVMTLTTEKRLITFVAVLLTCQVFRVLEPMYLHVTDGYWGSSTHLGGGELMLRLAGSPYDTINPNGLAFVIVSVLPFMHYLSISGGIRIRLLSLVLAPILFYALILTASRTGFLAVIVILFGIFLKSHRKVLMIVLAGIASVGVFSQLSDLQKERYLSLTSSDVRGADTAKGRIEGTFDDFEIAMRRPIFGHGLGTSAEANFHATGVNQLSHNLYTELLQELGFVGLVIFLFYINTLIRNYRDALRQFQASSATPRRLIHLTHAMQVWLLMNLMFSLASYGLSSYEWYLFGGLSVVLKRISDRYAIAPEIAVVPARTYG